MSSHKNVPDPFNYPQGADERSSTGSHPRVFICYAKQDAEEADEVYLRLKATGADPWLDKRSLLLGDDWEAEIKKAVYSADVFVVCLRPGFNEIGFRQKEIRWALDALQMRPPDRGFIIPFLVVPCVIPEWCRKFHAGSDLSQAVSFEELLRSVEHHCGVTLRSAEAARIARLVENLRVPEAQDRYNAAETLAEMGKLAEDAVPALARTLHEDNDYDVREMAAAALGEIRSTRAIPALIDALDSDGDRVRMLSASALGKIGTEEALSALSNLLEYGDQEESEAAAGAIADIAKHSLASYTQVLQHEDIYVRRAATTLFHGRQDSDAVSALRRSLRDSDEKVRENAASLLGCIGKGAIDAIPDLIRVLNDKNSRARSNATWALGEMGSAAIEALPVLSKLGVNDNDGHVRIQVFEVMWRIGASPEAALPAISKALHDGYGSVRAKALNALVNIAPDADLTLPTLVRSLKDPDVDVRSVAVWGIGKLETENEEAIAALRNALDDPHWGVREDAAKALNLFPLP